MIVVQFFKKLFVPKKAASQSCALKKEFCDLSTLQFAERMIYNALPFR